MTATATKTLRWSTARGPKKHRPYIWVSTEAEAKDAVAEFEKHPWAAVDTEFDSPETSADKAKVIIWSVSTGKGSRYVIDGALLTATSVLGRWLVKPKKVLFNYKGDADVIEDHCGLDIDQAFHADVMVMDWCVDETDRLHNLKHAGQKWLGWRRNGGYKDVFCYIPTGKKRAVVVPPSVIMYGTLPDEMLAEMPQWAWIDLLKHYAADDAEETALLFEHHKAKLKEFGYWKNYLAIDRRFSVTLRRCQSRGVNIDIAELQKTQRLVTVEMLRLVTSFRAACGKPDINVQSKQQMMALFFDELGWPTREDFKTAKGDPQLTAEAYDWYVDEHGFELARTMREYNRLKTKKGTFLDGLYDGVMYGPGAADHVLFTDFNQIGADTGRISSRKFEVIILTEKVLKKGIKYVPKKVAAGMNLQNIPNIFNDEFKIRRVFVAPPGYVMLVADYSAFELWMALYNCFRLGIESEMLKALLRGDDVHSITAAAVCELDCEWQDVKKLYPDKRNKEGKRCYHPDTEVLVADQGWKRIADLVMTDEVVQAHPLSNGGVSMSWTRPQALQKFTPEERALVHLENEGIDLRVTTDHRMLAFDKSGSPVVCSPEELHLQKGGWANSGWMKASKHMWSVSPVLLRLAVATQADGSYQEGAIRFGFTKKRKVVRLSRLLKQAGVVHTRTTRSDGVTAFYIPRLSADPIRTLLTPNKTLPWSWLDLARTEREAVLEEAQFWDGAQRGGRAYQYQTTLVENADVLQAMAAITGQKTRLVTPRTGAQPGWAPVSRLTIRDRATSSQAFYLQVKKEPYDGDVVCLTVPSSFVLVRDGGVPVISGNCNFNLLYGGQAWMLCSILGLDVRDQRNLDWADFAIETWNGLWPEMPEYQARIVDEAYKKGFVTTISGRRANLRAGLSDPDKKVRHHYENKAMNTPCQGSAADIMKVAMNRIEWNQELHKLGYEMLFPVHDEIVGVVPEENMERAQELVILEMKAPFADLLPFPLVIEAGHGPNWMEAK